MIAPESKLFQTPGKLQMPAMPGLSGDHAADPNPFSGIRRAGQAKRAMNFEKWQGKDSGAAGANADKASFDGAKNQAFGGQAKTQFGSMRQAKF